MKSIKLKTVLENVERVRKNCLQDGKNLFSVENSNFLTDLDIAKIIYKYATRKA